MLGALVFLAGAGFGTLDVSMNTEASAFERAAGRHLMSSFHALFSIGNIVGAFFVGKVVAYGGTLNVSQARAPLCSCTVSTLLIVDVPATQASSADAVSAAMGQEIAFSASQRKLIVMLGLIGFLAFTAEGGLMDWTAIYMVDILGTSNARALVLSPSLPQPWRSGGCSATSRPSGSVI